jgi:hypothetical protein
MTWKHAYPLPKRDVGVAVLLAFDRITEWVRWVSTKSGDQHERHISIVTCTQLSEVQTDWNIKPPVRAELLIFFTQGRK